MSESEKAVRVERDELRLEVEALCKRRDELLESNNRFEQEARDCRRASKYANDVADQALAAKQEAERERDGMAEVLRKTREALVAYRSAQSRMLEQWADGGQDEGDALRNELWRGLHACEADALEALGMKLPEEVNKVLIWREKAEAYERIGVGGNHLASWLIGYLGAGEGFPAYTTSDEEALEKLGVKLYDVWVCWAVIMRERDRVEEFSKQLDAEWRDRYAKGV